MFEHGDVLDSRDLIDRFNELSGQFDCLWQAMASAENNKDRIKARHALGDWLGVELDDEDISELIDGLIQEEIHLMPAWLFKSEEAELLMLLARVCKEGEDSIEDWEYGATLVNESYFEQYALDMAVDCGDVDTRAGTRWPYNHIDWASAADELKGDYTELEIEGTIYYAR